MDGQSLNITQDLITKLKEIIPGAFTEDKLNIEQLKQLLGEDINTDNERYQLNWAGKNEAYKVLQAPTTETLNPCFETSINWDNAQNIFIEGENLQVLKILQKSYYGKIKMIYVDPLIIQVLIALYTLINFLKVKMTTLKELVIWMKPGS